MLQRRKHECTFPIGNAQISHDLQYQPLWVKAVTVTNHITLTAPAPYGAKDATEAYESLSPDLFLIYFRSHYKIFPFGSHEKTKVC
jgi:hypothetical protein